jgi:hypothetical protein
VWCDVWDLQQERGAFLVGVKVPSRLVSFVDATVVGGEVGLHKDDGTGMAGET